MNLSDVKIMSEYLVLNIRKYNYDFNEFLMQISKHIDKVKDKKKIGEVKIEVDYEEVRNKYYLGNNTMWPIKIIAISMDKASFDMLVNKIIPYL